MLENEEICPTFQRRDLWLLRLLVLLQKKEKQSRKPAVSFQPIPSRDRGNKDMMLENARFPTALLQKHENIQKK